MVFVISVLSVIAMVAMDHKSITSMGKSWRTVVYFIIILGALVIIILRSLDVPIPDPALMLRDVIDPQS